jgi:hypothetical protein
VVQTVDRLEDQTEGPMVDRLEDRLVGLSVVVTKGAVAQVWPGCSVVLLQ